ncbi:hypothetical protein Esti_002890 [Eimeria stiedai]
MYTEIAAAARIQRRGPSSSSSSSTEAHRHASLRSPNLKRESTKIKLFIPSVATPAAAAAAANVAHAREQQYASPSCAASSLPEQQQQQQQQQQSCLPAAIAAAAAAAAAAATQPVAAATAKHRVLVGASCLGIGGLVAAVAAAALAATAAAAAPTAAEATAAAATAAAATAAAAKAAAATAAAATEAAATAAAATAEAETAAAAAKWSCPCSMSTMAIWTGSSEASGDRFSRGRITRDSPMQIHSKQQQQRERQQQQQQQRKQQQKQVLLGGRGCRDGGYLRTALEETDYGYFMQDEPLPLAIPTIAHRARAKLTAEYLQSQAYQPLATFLDYIAADKMVDNMVGLIQGALNKKPPEELLARADPLGYFSELRAIAQLDFSSSYGELYKSLLVDTPVGKYFEGFLQRSAASVGGPEQQGQHNLQLVEHIMTEADIDLLRNSLKKGWLEDFYGFVQTLEDSTTKEVMTHILKTEADFRVLSLAINSLSADQQQQQQQQQVERHALFPNFGYFYPDGTDRIRKAWNDATLRAALEPYPRYLNVYDQCRAFYVGDEREKAADLSSRFKSLEDLLYQEMVHMGFLRVGEVEGAGDQEHCLDLRNDPHEAQRAHRLDRSSLRAPNLNRASVATATAAAAAEVSLHAQDLHAHASS